MGHRTDSPAVHSVLHCGMQTPRHPAGEADGSSRQQTRTHSIPNNAPNFFSLLELCPTPTAQWCAGPCTFHSFRKFLAPIEKRYRLLVLPISRIGPGTDSPSAINSFSLPPTI